LVGLKRDLTLDERFDVVLRFAHAGAITVQSHVRQ
jgi:copper(I)-binding protein